MQPDNGIYIMKQFPDFSAAGFDIELYNERFRQKNVIIHARSSDIAYPEHWGCLSIKCAFGGTEYYEANNTQYGVGDDRYLILNEGKTYSSYIFSETPVESYTINFSNRFAGIVMSGLISGAAKMADDPEWLPGALPEFAEKLYRHDGRISPVLAGLYRLSSAVQPDESAIEEAYCFLLERMLLLQALVDREVRKVEVVKDSTRKELYKRLHYARDYMESCYMKPVSLQELAGIACLNTAYFLRQFKRIFGMTPHRYLMRRRVEVAGQLLVTTSKPVTEICYGVGYEDLTSFIRLFRQHYGLTPEKYRLYRRQKVNFHLSDGGWAL